MGELRRKAGVAKRRLINAKSELLPRKLDDSNRFNRATKPQSFAVENNPATERIHGKLSEAALDAVVAAVEADSSQVDLPVPPGAAPKRASLKEQLNSTSGIDRKRLELALGTYLEVPELLDATGLLTVQPPAEIHAMSHTPFAAGGGFYQADMVGAALETVDAPLSEGQRLLDFGCSSGRVARALAAAYPEIEMHGCDPNGPAIAWADAYLPAISFVKSENDPPTPYDDAFFDAAFGVSIWSHYSEPLALKWYDEMHRIIKPGGHLISTTHGPQSVAFYGAEGLRTSDQLADILDSLYDSGYWYAPEFGDKGDWGVVNSDWGTSFVSAEWMLDKLTPKWQIVEAANGRNESNQDVYVLRRT